MLKNPIEQERERRLREFTLEDKYTQEEGFILLTGIQALIRLPMDQHRADKRAGLNTATFISGYRGSPLGGIDLMLQQNTHLLDKHQIKFVPGVNEELAATAVFGSQTANLLPNPKYDGVLGVWYGKAPGVDRSTDAFKHANFAGVGRYGGVLALAGDDPLSKSSTLPSHSEIALYDSLFPTLYPGNVQEILDMGRLGFELSRYSGLWTGFKIVTNVADAFSTAEVSPSRVIIEDPAFIYRGKPWQHTQSVNLLTPYSLSMEKEIHEGRLEAAKHFARVNGINTITVPTSDAWLGIAAAGKTYYDLRQSLNEMGLDTETLRQYGIRLLKIGMLFPMEPEIVHEFADGLKEILVIEEKRAFIEMFIRDVLYHRTERPSVFGKFDENHKQLVPAHSALDTDIITKILATRLERHIDLNSIQSRVKIVDRPPELDFIPLMASTKRTPFYCSGCPHNSSTVAPEGALVSAGIGCHTMTLLMPEREISGLTQMGGEGAQWVGAAPFTENRHMFQNLGDGTLFHSATLAIRQSVATNVNITYKILYNSAVAMTGGQTADGMMTVPVLTHALRAEGVGRIIVTTDEPGKYANDVKWADGVQVWDRDRLDEAQRILQELPGVTVLIHDQECAAELRRKRRRGLAPDRETHIFINEAVCEGCGDCGVKSNCLSVFPVETEFGRKTQIHQASCNKDYSCLKGDCPAFITVIPEKNLSKLAPGYEDDYVLPAPQYMGNVSESNIFMMGIGGTGVVTANQVLATAAMLDGKVVHGLDQTGLSQKGGPVVSNLRIFDDFVDTGTRISAGTTDCYMVFDLLNASDHKNLARANPKRSVAIISTSEVPTGEMVASVNATKPSYPNMVDTVGKNTLAENNIVFDAVGLSETLFGSHMPANLMVIGAAIQSGVIPVTPEAMERAITLNGVAVKKNIQAFRVGRRVVADPEWANTIAQQQKRAGELVIQPEISPEAQNLIDRVHASGELLRLLEIRVPELIAYQDEAYAETYVDFVKYVHEEEETHFPGKTDLSEAVARYLFKLMAYKDEYEVARLHMRQDVKQVLGNEFGANAKTHYMLHPPILRAMGMKRKLKLGKWFDRVYNILVQMKALRGTRFDIFGYAEVRRVERALMMQYRALIEQAIRELNAETYNDAVKLANLPDIIRGYEDIKLNNVEKFWAEVERLGFSKPD